MVAEIISKTCQVCNQIETTREHPKIWTNKQSDAVYWVNDCGLKHQEAAEKMNICRVAVTRLLQRVKAKSPAYYEQYKKAKNLERKITRIEKQKSYRFEYNEKYKVQLSANSAVGFAVRAGKLPPAKNLKCVFCDNQAKHYHHHKGYELKHWFDVIPVCIPCHVKHQKSVNRFGTKSVGLTYSK